MADIEQYLRAILQATFGEQVRGSIHDAIEVMNTESEGSRADASAAQQSAAVVENAFTVTNGLMDQARAWHDEWEEIREGVSFGLIPMGGATVATLPEDPKIGWCYYMTQEDVTDERFLEGAGVVLIKDQRVYFSGKGKWTLMVDDGFISLIRALNIGKQNNERWDTVTLAANKWSEDTDGTWIYSFSDLYPDDEYDIINVLPCKLTTSNMYDVWIHLQCYGYEDYNIIRCRNNVPDIDLIVKVCIKKKGGII